MSLTNLCCESLINKIGEMPDQLQILVGEAAFKKLQKYERKKAKKEMIEYITKELSIILPDIIREEIKKQSLQKSTLSGRTYSISNNKLSSKTMLDIGGGYGSTSTARFQDAVKDLIGLDRLSIRKAYKRGRGKK